ncbi:hypothetical protein JMJ78_0015306, partial [Colletotrichum scovillei]
PKVKWVELDSHHPKTLKEELCGLYWSGIARDLDEILRFLDICENVPEPPTDDLTPESWLGFEAFAKRATRSAVNDAFQNPINFSALQCSECKRAIQGTHFRCAPDCPCGKSSYRKQAPVFCETCARTLDRKHDSDEVRKFHKSCVLSSCLSNEQARELCQCAGGDAESNQSKELYPFDQNDRVRHDPLCPLIRLKSQHCSSKLAEVCHLGMLEENKKGDIRSHLITAAIKTAAKITRVNEDLPSKGGVLFTVRDRLQLHPVDTPSSSVSRCFALIKDRQLFRTDKHIPRDRRVKAFMKQVVGSPFWSLREEDRVAEAEIVKDVAKASLDYFDILMEGSKQDKQKKSKAKMKILGKLRKLLHERVEIYIHSIVNKLFDKSLPLEWNPGSNNCQKFCDALIDRNAFGSFMVYPRYCEEKKHEIQACQVLYLMSFVSRIGCHDGFTRQVIPSSRATSANGHTEEFLLRFRRFAHHNDTDIIDSLIEYWTDWGGFRAPIFRHQDLFPWDCTEARTLKDETDHPQAKCGNCSLAKHLWAFPFDAWSVAQLHLSRERRFYAPSASTGEDNQNTMNEHDWEENRHRVLEAFQVLGSMAVAMHRSQVVRDSCRWNFKARGLPFENTSTDQTIFHKGRVTTLRQHIKKRVGRLVVQSDGPLIIHDRIKLAGIHRAQPMSYLYEHDMYHDCTLADWADLNHDGQVAAYTALRDFRSEHVDEIIEDAKRRVESKTPHPHGPFRGPGIDMNATSSMETEDWLPEDLVPEHCDGSYAEVDFEANEDTGDCDCLCDATGLSGFEQSMIDGGWSFSDGGSGFPVDTGSAGLDTSGGNGDTGDGGNNNGGGSGDGSHGGDNSHAGSSSNDQSWQSMMGMF